MEPNRSGITSLQSCCNTASAIHRSRIVIPFSNPFPIGSFALTAIIFLSLLLNNDQVTAALHLSAGQQKTDHVKTVVVEELSVPMSSSLASSETKSDLPSPPTTETGPVTATLTAGAATTAGAAWSGDELLTRSQQSLAIKSSFRTRRSGDPQVVSFRPEDEIWVVSARDSHHCPDDLSLLQVSQLIKGQLHPRSLLELVDAHQTDRTHETVVFVHGNRTDEQWGIARGTQVYENLFRKTCGEAPVRYVIWLWASEPELGRPIKDYKLKSKRAVAVGHTLARFLQQFPDRDLMLIGYSLGVQSILSALTDAELNLPKPGTGYRLNLIACAIDCQFASALPGCQPDGSIVSCTNIFNNCNDRVVAFANKICNKACGRKAISIDTIANQRLIDLGQVSFYEISHEVAAKHSIVMYSQSPTLNAALSNNRFANIQQQPILPAE